MAVKTGLPVLARIKLKCIYFLLYYCTTCFQNGYASHPFCKQCGVNYPWIIN